MIFGKVKQPAGAIDLSSMTDHLGDAREILRVFIPKKECVGGIYVNPYEGFDPFMFGMLLADLVHHGAKAYAHNHGMDEAAALYQISQGLSAELANPTTEVEQFDPEDDQ